MGARRLIAEALHHQRPVIVSINRKFITRTNIDEWIESEVQAGRLVTGSRFMVIDAAQGMRDYVEAQKSLKRAHTMLIHAALGACIPARRRMDPLDVLERFCENARFLGMGQTVGELKDLLESRHDAEKLIEHVREHLPTKTRETEQERLDRADDAARSRGWER